MLYMQLMLCNVCICGAGWGHHMICNKKYHFVIPSKDTVTACLNCEGGCDVVDVAKGKLNFVELQGHIMHGVFHSNGFGHLLCINGVEVGSDLTGHQIMEFWDRLCTGLKARLPYFLSNTFSIHIFEVFFNHTC